MAPASFPTLPLEIRQHILSYAFEDAMDNDIRVAGRLWKAADDIKSASYNLENEMTSKDKIDRLEMALRLIDHAYPATAIHILATNFSSIDAQICADQVYILRNILTRYENIMAVKNVARQLQARALPLLVQLFQSGCFLAANNVEWHKKMDDWAKDFIDFNRQHPQSLGTS